ncbi:hypothetical protein B7494_g2281 [Chlorociboria aeruginascens]|nr:hypothetical protein B7494_g2281 [Chlorociboria aeruginascens]
MATKTKSHGLNGMHTAGIFSDMTVDGPEIGTLVVIVDRAKNLPNRKTIGKQDPYCAARLGKEAKKTETDRRGGQTPRWDQELRFTVHDSPDYYQLKVTVFNDDKRTDLIGETWVNLQDVVVPGGGQNDIWHSLSCKGKYAGEIRIEITYYDTRPKQEKPEKTKQVAATNGIQEGTRESMTGPRQPKPPVKRRPLPSDPVTGAPPPAQPTPIPDHVNTPPQHAYQHPTYIPNQSPLQNIEYSTPPHHFSHSQNHGNSPSTHGYSAPGHMAPTPTAHLIQNDRYEAYDPMPEDEYEYQQGGTNRYEDESIDPRHQYHPQDPRNQYIPEHVPYELPQLDDFGPPPSPSGPPPPPPVHRSRHGSNQPSPASTLPPAIQHQQNYGFSSNMNSTSYDIPPNEIHRHSTPVYAKQPTYKAYSASPADDHHQTTPMNGNQQNPSRHNSYDSRYNMDYGAMQPTVEDAPPSPSPNYSGQRRSSSHTQQYDERQNDQVPSPAPLNLSGRGSSSSGRNSLSTVPSHQYSNSSFGYASTNAPVSFRDQSQATTSISSRTSFNSLPPQNYQQRGESEEPISNYGLPQVPPTLVAGMDPIIAQEVSDRIYHEKRVSLSQSAGNSPRGRYKDSPQYQPNRPHPLSYHEAATPFVPASASYNDHQNRYSTGTTPVVKPRPISPNPQAPARKSVSPSPGVTDGRRLSGVPFGPDSYNALNPSLAGSTSSPSLGKKYDSSEIDPDAKIITHDGREIDPSDHIPESNYAPLLESKHPKYASQIPDRNYAEPAPTGRRALKQAGRPHSMSTSSPVYMNSGPSEPSTPPTGRNRLQKKSNRMSAQPVGHSSPLAPISPYQDNTITPKSLPRAHTVDFANENYAPNIYGTSPGYRGSGPPLPAKVPINANSTSQQSDPWALLEEMKNIDLGSGSSRRRNR